METEFHLTSLLSSQTPVAEDKTLSLYILKDGLIYAVWKVLLLFLTAGLVNFRVTVVLLQS
jgi:hypothetical protein